MLRYPRGGVGRSIASHVLKRDVLVQCPLREKILGGLGSCLRTEPHLVKKTLLLKITFGLKRSVLVAKSETWAFTRKVRLVASEFEPSDFSSSSGYHLPRIVSPKRRRMRMRRWEKWRSCCHLTFLLGLEGGRREAVSGGSESASQPGEEVFFVVAALVFRLGGVPWGGEARGERWRVELVGELVGETESSRG